MTPARGGSSADCPPTIDSDDLPGDVVGVAHEKENRLGNVRGVTGSAHGNLRKQRRLFVLTKA